MLREKLYYEDNLPVSVRVCRIDEYPIHFHSDPEIVFLLAGSLTLKNGYYTYEMKANDIFVMNERELHSYSSTGEPNLALLFHFDVKYFSRYFPDLKNCFLVTDTDNSDDTETEALREALFRIVMETAVGGEGMEKRILESAHTLIALLLDNFQFFSMENGRFMNISGQRNNKILAERMFRIQNYLYDNFNKKISLQEIADREHLSIYYLSHIIRGATGLSYKEFLSFIRVEESERLLLGTDMKITQISDAVGFSAVRYYIKYFEKWYGMAPSEYREKFKDSADEQEVNLKIQDAVPDEICGVVKRLNNEIYREYTVASDPAEEEIVVRFARAKLTAALEREHVALSHMFAKLRRSCRPAALLYDLFTELGYAAAASGENYISSIRSSKRGAHAKDSAAGIEKAAIFIFTPCDTAADAETEFKKLIKAEGLNGRYGVTIMRMTAASVEAALRYSKRKSMSGGHGDIKDRIAAYPEVRRKEITAAGSLVFEVDLHRLGSELILFEKIPDARE
jgi:AraC-like DNA-binding protein